MSNTILSAVREHWERQGILNDRGATSEEISAFEVRYRVTLPDDVRAYFEELNGTRGGALGMDDSDLLGFWHLDQVRTFAEEGVNNGPEDQHAFVLADYSIWGYAFGIVLLPHSDARPFVVVTYGYPQIRVADSLADFFAAYLQRDFDKLLPRLNDGGVAKRTLDATK